MISAIFVDRPRLAVVIALVITIAGLIALTRIPVAQFPDIVPPQVQVTATYPGASAADVEASVAQPIEAQVVGVDKMIYMKSTSGNDGSYNLTVSFDLGSDPDIDTVNVNNRVQTALSQLPQEVQLEGLTVQKKSSAVLQFIMLYSETGKQDPLFITNYAIINVLDVLSRTPGVGQAHIFGALNYSMRIWFDTKRLDNLQLTPADVIAAIQAQNVIAPVGRIGARPISNEQQFQLNIQTQGRLTTPEQFGNIVLRANPDGSLLRIKDVARVELGAAERGHRGAASTASRRSRSASICRPAPMPSRPRNWFAPIWTRLSQRFPPGLKYLVNYDTTTFVFDTIHDVLITLLIAFVLVVIVVFLFLGTLRATLIPAIAVPVSVIGSFAVLLAMGYSANTISLLAMVLAIGILVDDAIVVVENVERVMEEEPELSPAEATKKAMAEITGPIIAITLVLFSVFVPIAFIPGVSGTLFRQFAVTISVAMAISALNALTLSPALCAVFLRHGGPKRGVMGWVLRRIDNVRDGYAAIVARLVRVSFLGVVAILAAAAAIYALSGARPDRISARRGPGRLFRLGAVARRRVGHPHQRCGQAHRGAVALDAAGPERLCDHRLFDHRQRQRAECGLCRADVETVRRPRRCGQFGAGVDRARIRRRAADPHRDRDPVQPAADHRAVDDRRLRIRTRRARRPGAGGDEQRHAGPARRRQPRPAAHPRVLDLYRQQPVDLSEHRSGKGAGAGPCR